MTDEEIQENQPTPEEPSITNSSDLENRSLRESLKECQDKYLRVLADAENARKRMQKERQELTQYAIENLLVEILHPLDNFEKALQFAESMSEEVKNWAIGFEMILNQFKQILISQGVVEYHSIGKRFDPHMHEALEMVETTDYEPGVVVEEFVRGYKIGDKPIRVARVKVAKAPQKEELKDTNK